MQTQNNTGYLCYLTILKMLDVTLTGEYEDRFKRPDADIDYEIISIYQD